MSFNPEFYESTKNNFEDKFGRLDNLVEEHDDAPIEDQAFLITHNFIEPKEENAKVSPLLPNKLGGHMNYSGIPVV